MQGSEKMPNFAPANEGAPFIDSKHRGVEQLVARQAHNLEVACSSPASATTAAYERLLFCVVKSRPLSLYLILNAHARPLLFSAFSAKKVFFKVKGCFSY